MKNAYALPSELIEPMITSALNLAVTRLLEEKDPTSEEAVERFEARCEGIGYVVTCNSCNNERSSDCAGVHAAMAMQNFMLFVARYRRSTVEERNKIIRELRRL